MRLDETDNGRDGGSVLLEEPMRSLRIAGVRTRLAGGVDPLQACLAARPSDENAGGARQGELADVVIMVDNESWRQLVGRSQR